MKTLRLIVFTLIFFQPFLVNAQKDTLWYDEKWKPAEKQNASFFRTPSIRSGDHYIFTDYYANGVIQMQGSSTRPDSVFWDGTVTWFYTNGLVKQKGTFRNNVRVDSFFNYRADGVIESISNYKNGKLHGTGKMFNKNGKLWAEMELEEGMLKERKLYEEEKLISKESFRQGNLLHGESLRYSKDGTVVSRETYVDGKRQGTAEEFYPSGKIKSRKFYKDGDETGDSVEFYESGSLKQKSTYVSGEPDGNFEIYEENGRLSVFKTYKEGKLNGFAFGKLEANAGSYKCYFKNDLLDSSCILFDKQERVLLQANFQQGILHGPFAIYREGKQIVDASFNKGSLLLWNLFHSNGKVFRSAKFDADSLIENWVTYDNRGAKKLETAYRFGGGHGTWNLYIANELRLQYHNRSRLLEEDIAYERRRLADRKLEEKKEEHEFKNKEEEDQYLSNVKALLTDDEVNSTTAVFDDITNVIDKLPSRFFKSEDSALMSMDVLMPEDPVSFFYADGAIRLFAEYEDFEYRLRPAYNVKPISFDSVRNRFEIKEIIDPDGLTLLLDHEKYKPGKNEVAVFAEAGSEAEMKVFRFSLGKNTLTKLKKNAAILVAIATHFYEHYKGEFSLAAITYELCKNVYDNKE